MFEDAISYNSMGVIPHAEDIDGVELYAKSLSPDEKFLFYVFCQAVIDLWNHRWKVKSKYFEIERRDEESGRSWKKRNKRAQKRFEESRNNHDIARHWIKSRETYDILCFEMVCQFLDFDPERTRKILLAGPPKKKIDWRQCQ